MRSLAPQPGSNASSSVAEASEEGVLLSLHPREEDRTESDDEEGPGWWDDSQSRGGGRPCVLANFLLSQVDNALDGWVAMMLLEQGSFGCAVILAMIVLVPQLVMWLFLQRYGMTSLWALGRILATPGMVAAVFFAAFLLPPETVTPARLRPVLCGSIFYISFSMESLYRLKQAAQHGSYDLDGWWATVGRDLIQPPLSGVFTLYLVFSKICPVDAVLVASVISSTLNFTKTATQLHFYSNNAASWYARVEFAVAHTLPRAVWRVLSLAMLAHLLRPSASPSWAMRWFLFSTYDLLRNFLILHVATPGQLLIPVLALLSFTMLFTGPPRFLTYLERACIEHYCAQLVSFAFALCATLYLDGSWLKAMLHLWQSHSKVVIVWAIAMLWALASAFILHQKKSEETGADKEKATEKLRDAAKDRDVILCSLLLELDGASRSKAKGWVEATFRKVGSRWRGEQDKWRGIAACDHCLYGAPKNAKDVLEVNLTTGVLNYWPLPNDVTNKTDKSFFFGIAEFEKKLYCAPSSAEGVLVIDSTTKAMTTILLPPEVRELPKKCAGIAELDGKLYCAPRKADFVLVVDVKNWEVVVRDIPPEMKGDSSKSSKISKFSGIAALGHKLYCCPRYADKVLVVDPDGGMSSIDLPEGFEGKENKWSGIAACGSKLYCAPLNAHGVLVIDPNAEQKTSVIPLPHNTGNFKWSSIKQHRGRLYCCPHNSTDMLIIDPKAEEGEQLITAVIDETPVGKSGKWSSIAVGSDGRLFCVPCATSTIAIIDVTESFLVDDLLKRPRLRAEAPLSWLGRGEE